MTAKELSEEVVAVTGAGRGLGLAIARSFLESGARVALMDVDGPRARESAAAIGGPDRVRAYAVDVGDEDAVRKAFAAAAAELGTIGVLVNNAGVCGRELLQDLDLQTWRRVLEVNLTGAFLCMKAVVPGMISRGRGGRIVSIGSLAGRSGGIATSVAYAASKAGLAGLTRAAAKQLAAHGILVNCVAPSTLETDMTAGWPPGSLEGIRATVPLGRLGTVEDVAGAVLFLASPAARYITGVTLDITGGLYVAP